MKLESLRIRYCDYKNIYIGAVEFTGESGKVEINVKDEDLKMILGICAASIVNVAHEAANMMTGEVIEATGLLLPEPEESNDNKTP